MIDFITILPIAQLVLILILILFWYKNISPKAATTKKGTIKKKSVWKMLGFKKTILIILATLGLTILLTFYTRGVLTKAIMFFCIVAFAPYFVINNLDRIKKEDTFDDVIIYCNNMCMLLKQTHKVPSSLKTVKDDVGIELKEDIEILISAFKEGKEKTLEVMKAFENKYPYTCVNNLDLIMFHLFWESPELSDDLFNTYHDDIAKLQQDVENNKTQRKTMRIVYIGLTIAGYLAYWLTYDKLYPIISEAYETTSFKLTSMAYTFLCVFSVFLVDRYYNSNTTKE